MYIHVIYQANQVILYVVIKFEQFMSTLKEEVNFSYCLKRKLEYFSNSKKS